MSKLMVTVFAVATALIVQPAVSATAKLSRDFRFGQADPAGLEVDNLIGDVRIERGSGDGFEVDVQVTAEAGAQSEADALARAVDFRERDAGADSTLQVLLPRKDFPQIFIPDGPSGWLGGRMYVRYLGERRRLTGDVEEGVRIRVDLVIRAPADSRLTVRNTLGDVTAEGFAGELTLDGTRGKLRAHNGSGPLVLDTGSGTVEVAGHSGEVSVDTGSGPVTVSGCECGISADTGSGPVTVRDSRGSLEADTGSGEIRVTGFAGSVLADTGSGSVQIEGLSEAIELGADTGSGSVRVEGDLSSLERLDVDTGSGSVILDATAWPAMEIVLDTGSGAIEVDIPGAELGRDEDRRRVVRIGDGAHRGMIDTGSGSVRIRARPAPPM